MKRFPRWAKILLPLAVLAVLAVSLFCGLRLREANRWKSQKTITWADFYSESLQHFIPIGYEPGSSLESVCADEGVDASTVSDSILKTVVTLSNQVGSLYYTFQDGELPSATYSCHFTTESEDERSALAQEWISELTALYGAAYKTESHPDDTQPLVTAQWFTEDSEGLYSRLTLELNRDSASDEIYLTLTVDADTESNQFVSEYL